MKGYNDFPHGSTVRVPVTGSFLLWIIANSRRHRGRNHQ